METARAHKPMRLETETVYHKFSRLKLSVMTLCALILPLICSSILLVAVFVCIVYLFDWTLMFQSNGADQFGINNKNLFQDDSQSAGPDVPPALPPKTGTPTRPPPPPPGQYLQCVASV